MNDGLMHLVHGVGSGLALFLIGVNFAFLLHLGGRLVRWFAIKIAATMFLLVYVCASMAFADPTLFRTLLGIAAMTFDIIAVLWMWHSVVQFAKNGVVGIVPLLRVRASDIDPHAPRRA